MAASSSVTAFHSLRPPDGAFDEDAALATLRHEDPVHWEDPPGWWLITRHADVKHISRNPGIFSSRPRGPWHALESRFSMQADDGPTHRATRSVVSRAFTPRAVARLARSALAYTDEAIDGLITRGRCDIVEDIAIPVPMRVIADILGLESEMELFRAWTHTLTGAFQDDRTPDTARQQAAANDFSAYVRSVVRERSARPGEDLISAMLASEGEGVLQSFARDPLPGVPPGDGVLGFIAFLVAAGSETTRHGIAQGIRALLAWPGQHTLLRARPELMDSAVEEILRWTTPGRALRRTVMSTTELRGKTLRAGDSVVMLYRSANRDEEVFADPECFRVDRQPNEHLSFGIGTHFCLGANLARMELRVTLERILQRLPELRLDPDSPPRHFASSLVDGLASLPALFTPAGPDHGTRGGSSQGRTRL